MVTIEDAAELMLRQRHVIRMETRPPNIEGQGAVRQRQLVINALRMRPDRIIVGEVRGEEALDMLQAMNTGHDGSLTTIHANSPRDALYRMDTMVAMTNLNIPERAIRHQVASAIHLIVQIARQSDGKRYVTADYRNHRHGRRRHRDAGHLPVRTHGSQSAGQGHWALPGDRRTSQVQRAPAGVRRGIAFRAVRTP